MALGVPAGAMKPNHAVISKSFYEDEAEISNFDVVHIPSMTIENNFLKVNLIYAKFLDDLIEKSGLPDSLLYYENLVELSIDDSIYHHQQWNNDGGERNRTGILTMVDISNLANGPHILKVKRKNLPNKEYQEELAQLKPLFPIPFWKDVH
jgi:hypothetical protein